MAGSLITRLKITKNYLIKLLGKEDREGRNDHAEETFTKSPDSLDLQRMSSSQH